jgi:hypothetical protein
MSTPDPNWSDACTLAVDVCSRVSSGADLAVELSREFCRLITAARKSNEENVRLRQRLGNIRPPHSSN